MADTIRYVNTGNTTSGDGTTNETDSSPDSAYISLAAWDTAEAADITGTGGDHIVYCDASGGVDTASPTLTAGWVTDATHRVIIRAASGSENNGVSRENGGSGYQVKAAGASYIDFRGHDLIVEDMEFTMTGTSTLLKQQGVSAGTDHTYRRCIFSKTDATASSNYFLQTSDADGTLNLENCIVIAYNTRPFLFQTGTIVVDHCAFLYENSVGGILDASCLVTNTWMFNNGGAAIHNSSTAPDASSDGNACSGTSFTDESWSGTNQESLTMANEITAVGTDFADPSSADCTIKEAGTESFVDNGVGSLGTDITGASRDASPDIGPFEKITAAAGGPPTLTLLGVG